MKKTLLTATLIGMVGFANAQWTCKNVDNGLDRAYKIAYTKEDDNCILKLEKFDDKVIMYLQGDYFCNESVDIDFSFFVNGKWEKYNFKSSISTDHTCIWLEEDLSNQTDFLKFFLMCSYVRMRVNYYDDVCTTKVYDFDMTNSSKAYNFIKNSGL